MADIPDTPTAPAHRIAGAAGDPCAGRRRASCACPRGAPPRCWRRRCWRSASPSAPPSARRPTPPSRAPRACRCCSRRCAALASRRSRPRAPRGAQPPAVTAQATPPPATTVEQRLERPPRAPRSVSELVLRRRAPSTPSTPAPTTAGGGSPRTTLPPVTNVWLIELSGTTFAEALAQPRAAPYIDAQAVPAGTLLSSWSAARRQRLRE